MFHPLPPLTDDERADLRRQIASERADALIYGILGCPPHERTPAWIAHCAASARDTARATFRAYPHLRAQE